MGDISNYVTLNITRDTLGVARANFGTPLFLSNTAAWPERVRTYQSLAEVAEDFPATTSPEYLAASAFFSQSKHVKKIKIARAALPATMVQVISVSAVRNSYAYTVTMNGEGFTAAEVSYTSDGTATNDEIVAGLVTAINGVASNNYTAAATGSAGSQVVTITADAAGDWFGVEIADRTSLKVAATHADPGVATDLAAILLADADWYTLHTCFNSNAYVLAAAAWCESNKRLYLVDLAETNSEALAAGGSDTADDLEALSRNYTAAIYHPKPTEMLSCALAGYCLAIDPGTVSFYFRQLTGVTAIAYTSTQATNLAAKNCTWFWEVAGKKLTDGGKNAFGEWIDVQIGLDATDDEIKKSVFEAMIANDKLPYTDAGAAVIENAVRGAVLRKVKSGFLAESPAPEVTVPLVADVSSTDRGNRHLPDVKFNANVSGGIKTTAINGTVSV